MNAGVLSPRRVLATRETAWARRLARMLHEHGATPNAVSVAGAGWALAACAAFALVPSLSGTPQAIAYLAAAAAIQLRLLCNLLDGMLAVEEGLKTKLGDLYNEIPDRLADVAILLGAGAADNVVLGCAAAIAALFTAYIRVLGGSLGVEQRFSGPMAKQHRMFVLTLAAIFGAGEAAARTDPHAMRVGLLIVVVGAIVTAGRRTRLLARDMGAR